MGDVIPFPAQKVLEIHIELYSNGEVDIIYAGDNMEIAMTLIQLAKAFRQELP